ncbi:alpha/beta-hydrolase [Pluteus cervinus]|uniref:Alpha/beta-hydrolase n=1 Tax=Pluteus cervinus TaxID=181527 RepID=A0ACD3BFH0_9AGAR|nr:alpha/beta-hydrolase [Pluteus cervinus]
MVAFGILIFQTLVVASLSSASPLPLQIPHINPQDILCKLPIVNKFLCPRTGTLGLNIPTPLGTASGTTDPSGAYRYVVKYAHANRWQDSTLVTSWNLPTGTPNATSLPPACPQSGVDPSVYNEDCLSMVVYVPPGLTVTSNVPTMVWFHGGSFVVGSATGPGMDGSNLAIATQSIVITVQYRLGALGFLVPGSNTNLAVKDSVHALQFVNRVIASFGGNPSKVTIAGQSSGASMVRTLLGVPSASTLFRSAILQSDVMDYGPLSTATYQALLSNFKSRFSCAVTDTSCWNALGLGTILTAQTNVYNAAMSIDPAAGNAQPIRPVLDGTLIASPLDSTQAFPSVSKPLLITTVKNEAALAIYSAFTSPLPDEALQPICDATFGESRTDTILASTFYQPTPGASGTIDVRAQLQLMGTDYLWKCSAWTFARNWVQNGGSTYVGYYSLGASYPGNANVPFCTQSGAVCHQDDIQIVFGTVASPTTDQTNLVNEMQKRYKAFLTSGNPNTAGLSTWTPATTSDLHPQNFGGSNPVDVGACQVSFWGSAVQYDYQYYTN